jgi:iron complex transport system substrate-binding protein
MALRLLLAALVAALPFAARAATLPAVPPPTGHPIRVMSMSVCTDQIVLALLPPARIASVSWLARDPQSSLMTAAAAHTGINHGAAEDVARARPDIVIADSFTSPMTLGMLKRIGWPMLVIEDPETFDQIRNVTRQIAVAVDERSRGEALIAAMDRKLAALARHPGPGVRVAAWDGAGLGARKGSLYDAVLARAGAINVADEREIADYGHLDVEVLLKAAPALLLQGGYDSDSLRGDLARHPLVRRYWGDRTLGIRQAYYLCGTPFIADAALDLRRRLSGALARTQKPLPFARGGTR